MVRSSDRHTDPPPTDTFVKLLHIILLFLVAGCVCLPALISAAAERSGPEEMAAGSEQSQSANRLASICMRFDALNTRIRDNRIEKKTARTELRSTLAELREEYYRSGGVEHPQSAWVFPLAGYDVRAVSGGRRHGFISSGYDYFSGNRHGGHPSYDIFIRDRNQDGLDDRNGRPVSVLSMTGGIVVSLEREWQAGSRLRGGRYVWVYDPGNDLLVYYAHNAELTVKLGEIVKPGDVLGVVGRSGFNAAKRRSPTHMHLTMLKVQNGKAEPIKAFQALQRARPSNAR